MWITNSDPVAASYFTLLQLQLRSWWAALARCWLESPLCFMATFKNGGKLKHYGFLALKDRIV